MDAKSYIAGKLVPEMLRQKIINIEGSEELEFINIDSVEIKELTEAFALTKPYSVDVQLSRFSERDVKHKFNLVVKVSRNNEKFKKKIQGHVTFGSHWLNEFFKWILTFSNWITRNKNCEILNNFIELSLRVSRSLQIVHQKFTIHVILMFYLKTRRQRIKILYQLWAAKKIFPSEFSLLRTIISTWLRNLILKINKFEPFPDFITLKFWKIDVRWFWTISLTTDGGWRLRRSIWIWIISSSQVRDSKRIRKRRDNIRGNRK